MRCFRGTSEGGGLGEGQAVGDAGQRIYSCGISLRRLGINITGRSFQLRINYRTTLEIERAASIFRSETEDDLDEHAGENGGSLTLLRGPQLLLRLKSQRGEKGHE